MMSASRQPFCSRINTFGAEKVFRSVLVAYQMAAVSQTPPVEEVQYATNCRVSGSHNNSGAQVMSAPSGATCTRRSFSQCTRSGESKRLKPRPFQAFVAMRWKVFPSGSRRIMGSRISRPPSVAATTGRPGIHRVREAPAVPRDGVVKLAVLLVLAVLPGREVRGEISRLRRHGRIRQVGCPRG